MAEVADYFMLLTRCKGGRVIAEGYMCNHCGKDPDDKCGKPDPARVGWDEDIWLT